jgi:hypothetical protein
VEALTRLAFVRLAAMVFIVVVTGQIWQILTEPGILGPALMRMSVKQRVRELIPRKTFTLEQRSCPTKSRKSTAKAA